MRHLMKSDPADPAIRRYQGFIADSARWERFTFRPDDVVISTPSKCGTTWMQMIVGMLLRVVSGQGIQVSFVIVAAVVLAAFLLGWRAVSILVLKMARSTSGRRSPE